MQPLEKNLRNKLERTVKDAREIAEEAARAAVEQLGVGEAKPFSHLSEDQRELRRRFRAHGRQLGDCRNPQTEAQEIGLLLEEAAYQHWHRMLFARFLTENDLLMYPDAADPVAVTLEDCEELAHEEGAKNGWELAARFAAQMLPQIFRLDSPVFELVLPPEHQQKLEQLLLELPTEVFTASDSLGWVYQFWQTKKKDEVNASGVKIGARELPAVTQLFTEPYMVSFLLDNSLGAWWASRRLTTEDLRNAETEEELRTKAAIPGVPLEYLRFVKNENSAWTPAAGNFDDWPEQLSELRTLDPCCGSGHFLVAALLMLVPMRMELEGLTANETVDRVLSENIYGLELDKRCVELAAFALALTAWVYPGCGGYRPLPEMNLACSGLAISAKKEEWLNLAGGNTNLRLALGELYNLFKEAPVLGSLIDPKTSLGRGSLFEVKWDMVGPLLRRALSREKNDEKNEMGVVAQGLAKAANLLSLKYHLILTNPPYLARGKQAKLIRDFASKYYEFGNADISTVFLKRFSEFLDVAGTHASVTPLNWVFIKSYRNLREDLLINSNVHLLAKVGSGATAKASWDVLRALAIVSNYKSRPTSSLNGVEVTSADEEIRAQELRDNPVKLSTAKQICLVPDYRFAFDFGENQSFLGDYGKCIQGILPADRGQLVRVFWEAPCLPIGWEFLQGSCSETKEFNGWYQLFAFELFKSIFNQIGGRLQGQRAFGSLGVSISKMRELPVSLYSGKPYDGNAHAFIPNNPKNLPAIWAYLSSEGFASNVRALDQKIDVTNSTIDKVPFDLDHWKNVADKKYPNGLPKPYSHDPTQWIFHGHPVKSEHPLHVSVVRLIGYQWPAELDTKMELSIEAHERIKKSGELISYADEDGIVCIPPVRGEASASDRLLNLLAAAYGDEWSNSKLSELLKQVDHVGKTLETWLRDNFFTQHCKLFHHRPFIWHIWDGLNDGFAVLVNYHKLDRRRLETLIYTYLGDWIKRQNDDIASGIDGAQERLAAAESLKKKLELILAGEKPYDIFVRWKPIENQPIGWQPDLNDGVRLNIRPFMTVADVKKKGAGVLRDKPNINWNKDRGKDVESAPWYHLFKGDRINDHHLTLAEKRNARSQQQF